MYSECSACAESSQKNHFQLLQIRISLLVAIAIFGAIAWTKIPNFGMIPPLVIAVSLSILFIFTVIMENKKFEKNWFNSRAVAEMIKRESWLCMMKAKPYQQQNNQEAKARALKQIVESEALHWTELTHNHEVTQISETMDKIGNAGFDEERNSKLNLALMINAPGIQEKQK